MKRKFKDFLKRKKSAHKGDFGKILIVAGSRGLSGAASLTALAALRSGAGLVTLVVPDAIYSVVARRDPEVMVHPVSSTTAGSIHLKSFKKICMLLKNQDVLAIGPGLSRHPSTVQLIHKLIVQSKLPVVIDADALNALEDTPEILLKASAPLILTPHAGEFERVFWPGGRRPEPRGTRRKAVAKEIAEKHGIFLILKGHRTVVAAPNGRTFINTTGNPGMAKGGSGDVLTGVIAGLLGRDQDVFKTVSLAVFVHGLAGDLAAEKVGLTGLMARDILEYLPIAFKKLEK